MICVIACFNVTHSQLSIKTLSDLQLIKADAAAFGISMRRLQSTPPTELLPDDKLIPPSLLVLYLVMNNAYDKSEFADDHS